MIKFYLKNIKWWTSQKIERHIAENVEVTRVVKCPNTRRARKVPSLKAEEGTTWSNLVMVDKPNQFSERKQRPQRKWHWSNIFIELGLNVLSVN
jgi:hypothetical protein